MAKQNKNFCILNDHKCLKSPSELSGALNSLSPLGGKWAWSRAAPSVPGLWIKTENSDMDCRSQQRGLCAPKGQSLLISLQLTERRWIVAFSCHSFMRLSCAGKVVTMQGSQSKISAGKLVTRLNRRRAEKDEDGRAEVDRTHRVLRKRLLLRSSQLSLNGKWACQRPFHLFS